MQKGSLLQVTIRNYSQVITYAAKVTHVKDANSFIVSGVDHPTLPPSPTRLIHMDEVGKSAVLSLTIH